MKRNIRHDAIRRIVRAQSISTQLELVEALHKEGFVCTQATVSRDIASMHLRKLAGGVYVLEEDLYLQRILSEFTTNAVAAQNLVILHTQPQTAGQTAKALDSSHLEGLLGTIAGEDTIMVATDSPQNAQILCKLIKKLASLS